MSINCPKCQSKMRSTERKGVTVQRCKQCGGIFLDHGELEQLIAAEARFFGLGPIDPAGARQRMPDYDAPRRPVADERTRTYTDKQRGKTKKRKKAFLEDFFD